MHNLTVPCRVARHALAQHAFSSEDAYIQTCTCAHICLDVMLKLLTRRHARLRHQLTVRDGHQQQQLLRRLQAQQVQPLLLKPLRMASHHSRERNLGYFLLHFFFDFDHLLLLLLSFTCMGRRKSISPLFARTCQDKNKYCYTCFCCRKFEKSCISSLYVMPVLSPVFASFFLNAL